ncbi:hypothetical protein [Bacillus sp. Marseille-P3661]|uniref:hypothetical protein n=1 Tax=Bacillus sp. Marseille-P3661 TaxID=1936234 RepID=UPI000C852B48|nr:hypothetical protein [Bacillus sp. Marseille-P3661]
MADKIQITRKSVAFNIDDPDQMALLEHASKRANFSSYIKRLIQRDLEGGVVPQNQTINDWEQLITDLQTEGWTPQKVQKALKIVQSLNNM